MTGRGSVAWTWSRRAGRLLLALCLSVGVSGCYEGWDDYVRNGPGPNPPSPPPSPSPPPVKPIGYILFQPVSMAADAMQSGTCFPHSDIRVFRQNEWAERIQSIQAALGGIADTVVTATVSVAAADCTTMTAVQTASVDSSPWGSDASPESDTSGKPDVHLVASFWEGEPALAPQATVVAPDWAAWQQLQAEGRDAKSLRYFVISNSVNGYFSQWQAAVASEALAGTPIDTPDPTAGGQTARDATVASDTQALVNWIVSQVH